jgi:hypothetical protein
MNAVSESLVYPEHTVVVMFGHLVIGAGFITPSGYITYIALHKEWQGYHIGTYMLYHLIMVRPVQALSSVIGELLPLIVVCCARGAIDGERQGYHVTRLGHQPCDDPVPKILLQGRAVPQKLLRQVSAA